MGQSLVVWALRRLQSRLLTSAAHRVKHAHECRGMQDYVCVCEHRTVIHAGNGNPADETERKGLPNFFSDPLGFTTFLLLTVPYRIGCSLVRTGRWLLGLKITNNNHAFVNYSQVCLSSRVILTLAPGHVRQESAYTPL